MNACSLIQAKYSVYHLIYRLSTNIWTETLKSNATCIFLDFSSHTSEWATWSIVKVILCRFHNVPSGNGLRILSFCASTSQRQSSAILHEALY